MLLVFIESLHRGMGTPVIVTDMHRSGTSLLANVMLEAGLAMGERLKGATAHNVKGHFEDLDFVELHDDVLAANGTSMYLEHLPPTLRIGDEHRVRAAELIARRKDLSVWGWKDPRTTLFLDFWLSLLPGARFVFIYRRAEQVVDSLRRRSDKPLNYQFHGAWPLRKLGFSTFKMNQAIRMWLHYNAEIIRFCAAHAERTCTLDLDRLSVQVPLALQRMRREWGLPFDAAPLASVFSQELLHTQVPAGVAKRCGRADVSETYAALSRLADGR